MVFTKSTKSTKSTKYNNKNNIFHYLHVNNSMKINPFNSINIRFNKIIFYILSDAKNVLVLHWCDFFLLLYY